MKFLTLTLVAAFLGLGLASPLAHHPKRQNSTCCANGTTTRVEFASMPATERQEYTAAIQCMMDLPSQLDSNEYPAATSRFFDYAVIHVSRSQYIHNSGYFLTWHRYFTHLFERDLRTLCAYAGRYPYWNFAATSGNLSASATFDGSASSLSGDGEYANTGDIVLGPNLTLPHGTGGGCVTTGPFANLSVPMRFIASGYLRNGTLPADAYALNPSCLQRDLNAFIASSYTNPSQVSAATHASGAAELEALLNGAIGGGALGVHSGAHFQVGGTVGSMSSIHVSPQDPVWYAMHTFVELIYDSWQRTNPALRDDVSGTMTAGNVPPSDEVTLDSVLPDWGYLEPRPVTVRELLSTTEGPFCYEYDVHIS